MRCTIFATYFQAYAFRVRVPEIFTQASLYGRTEVCPILVHTAWFAESVARAHAFFVCMSKLNLYHWKPSSSHSLCSTFDPDEQRRNELCLQLAENLHDLGACEFSRELHAGTSRSSSAWCGLRVYRISSSGISVK